LAAKVADIAIDLEQN